MHNMHNKLCCRAVSGWQQLHDHSDASVHRLRRRHICSIYRRTDSVHSVHDDLFCWAV